MSGVEAVVQNIKSLHDPQKLIEEVLASLKKLTAAESVDSVEEAAKAVQENIVKLSDALTSVSPADRIAQTERLMLNLITQISEREARLKQLEEELRASRDATVSCKKNFESLLTTVAKHVSDNSRPDDSQKPTC